jgi:3-hydroxyisobutyrate dehydrogenase-like beta-hydroxyacid dehydrogenase
MKRIGFAGLGRMGQPMVRNLAHAGFEVALWNRSSDKANALAGELNLKVCDHPRELSETSDIVITMLSDDAASEQVHFGENGLFVAHHGAEFIVEMGTMSPAHIRMLANKSSGCQVIDAPVSGATEAAKNAQLMIMVGADQSSAEPIIPALTAMSRKIIYLGATSAGAVMKLSVNMLIHGLNQTISEALTLAEAAGIEIDDAYDAIEESAAAAPMLHYRRPLYIDEQAHAVTFALSLARKDMGLALALGAEYGVAMPQSELTFGVLKQAEAAGFGTRDMASVINYMRENKT